MSASTTTDFQLLLRAYDVVAAVPQDRFVLDVIVETRDGVIVAGDAAYWLCQDPFFKSLGLSNERVGGIYFNGQYMGARLTLAAVLKMPISVVGIVFGPVREHEVIPGLSDKNRLLGRLRSYMREHNVEPPMVDMELG